MLDNMIQTDNIMRLLLPLSLKSQTKIHVSKL
jgi:hypothetical protein